MQNGKRVRCGARGRSGGCSLKLLLVLVLIGGFLRVVMMNAQQDSSHEEPPSRRVRGRGCLVTGVENGCFSLRDEKTGQVYTLLFGSQKTPRTNSEISFQGVEYKGMTTCLQGKAIEVSKWSKVKGRCGLLKEASPAVCFRIGLPTDLKVIGLARRTVLIPKLAAILLGTARLRLIAGVAGEL